MNVMDYIKARKKKSDDAPGSVLEYLDEECPACGKKLKLKKPCCTSKYPTKECVCGWKLSVVS